MFKMAETNNVYSNLPIEQEQQFRLNKINEIKDFLIAEIKEWEILSKRLSKYINCFYYFDKLLIVLSITTGSVSIATFATVIRTPVGIVSASFSLVFSIFTVLIKNY